jgi:hypothetical protein
VVPSIDLPQVAASAGSRHPTVLSGQIAGATGNVANPSAIPACLAVGRAIAAAKSERL